MATSRTRRSPRAKATREGLLPATMGHVARGRAIPHVPSDAVEAFAERVGAVLDKSRQSGRETGFLAYAAGDAGAPFVAEDDAEGSPTEIQWHWNHADATVAFSFHTHPAEDASLEPSGIDLVGALVRGDHVVYVATHDGRIAGWRMRNARNQPRAVDAALRALAEARKLEAGFVDFLYDAFEALRPNLVELAYSGRVVDGKLVADAAPGIMLRAKRSRARVNR